MGDLFWYFIVGNLLYMGQVPLVVFVILISYALGDQGDFQTCDSPPGDPPHDGGDRPGPPPPKLSIKDLLFLLSLMAVCMGSTAAFIPCGLLYTFSDYLFGEEEQRLDENGRPILVLRDRAQELSTNNSGIRVVPGFAGDNVHGFALNNSSPSTNNREVYNTPSFPGSGQTLGGN